MGAERGLKPYRSRKVASCQQPATLRVSGCGFFGAEKLAVVPFEPHSPFHRIDLELLRALELKGSGTQGPGISISILSLFSRSLFFPFVFFFTSSSRPLVLLNSSQSD